MNNSKLFVLLTFIVICYASFSEHILDYMESGTSQLVMIKPKNINKYTYPIYKLNYKKSFDTKPSVIIGLDSIKYHQTSNIAYYIKPFNSWSQSQNSYSTLNTLIYGDVYDTSFIVKFRFFARDRSKTQAFIYTFQAAVSSPTAPFVYEMAPYVNSQSLCKNCFITSIYCYHISQPEFHLKTQCSSIDNNEFKVEFFTNAMQTYCDNIISQKFFCIIIYPILNSVVTIGGLQANQTSSPTLSFKKDQGTIFFIGLTGFILPAGSNNSIAILLNEDGFSINSQNRIFKQAKYQYFHFQKLDNSILKINYYPLEDKILFQFTNFEFLSQDPLFTPTLLQKQSWNDNILKTKIISLLKASFQIKLKRKFQTFQKTALLDVTMIIAISMSKNYFKNQLNIQFLNIPNTTPIHNFSVSNDFKISSFQNNIVNIKQSNNLNPQTFYFTYQSNANVSYVQLPLFFPLKISTSSKTTLCHCIIYNIYHNIQYQLKWRSSNIIGLGSFMNGSIIQTHFDYLSITQNETLTLQYEPINLVYKIKMNFSLELVTVKTLQLFVNSSYCKLIFINLPQQIQLTQFKTDLSNLHLSSLEKQGQIVKILTKYQTASIRVPFSTTFSSSTFDFQAITTDLQIIQRFMYFTFDIFEHWINFTFKNIEGMLNLPIIKLFGQHISINDTEFTDDSIVIKSKFTRTVHGNQVSISFDFNQSTIYHETTTLNLLYQDSFVIYCLESFQSNTQGFQKMSIAIVFIYWIIFILSMFFCQKIYAVQLLFTLQFAYMSLIPIGIYCPPFRSLSMLRYSFGWNEIPFNIEQVPINLYYQVLGIKSNFLSNVNLMLTFLLICPIIYVIMVKIGKTNTDFQTKPRLLNYGKTFLLDVPFTIIYVNVPNICVSFVVGFQAFKFFNILSLTASIICLIIILITAILFIVFRTLFRQYHKQFCDNLKIGRLSIQTSYSLRKIYPLILQLEIIFISTVISFQSLMKISLYICLGIMSFITILILIIAPYKSTIDNVRLFVHRLFMLILCSLQIVFQRLRVDQAPKSNVIYNYPWIVMTILLIIVLVINLPYLIYKSIFWLKTPNMIDQKLYNQKYKQTKSNSYYPNKPPKSGSYYPALQYSLTQAQKKRLLDIPIINKSKDIYIKQQ